MIDYSLKEVESVSSKQFSPRSQDINAVIIHDIMLEPDTRLVTFEDVLDFFQSGVELSAHYFVDQDRVVRMVNESQRAYHAGKSILNGREDVNQFSVGIELIHHYQQSDFTDFQYEWTAWKTSELMRQHDFDFSWVTTHKAIRESYRMLAKKFKSHNIPAEKVDPYGFAWNSFSRLVLKT